MNITGSYTKVNPLFFFLMALVRRICLRNAYHQQGCALRRIEGSLVLWTCKILGAQHMIFIKKLRFASCPRAKVRRQEPPGSVRAQPWLVTLHDCILIMPHEVPLSLWPLYMFRLQWCQKGKFFCSCWSLMGHQGKGLLIIYCDHRDVGTSCDQQELILYVKKKLFKLFAQFLLTKT